MGLFSKLFGSKTSTKADTTDREEHAVLLHLRYEMNEDGFPAEDGLVERYHDVQDRLEAAISRASVGELDGDEFGDGKCVVYCNGPDADKLWEVMRPVLVGEAWPDGSHAIKRYGEPGDNVRIERLDL